MEKNSKKLMAESRWMGIIEFTIEIFHFCYILDNFHNKILDCSL